MRFVFWVDILTSVTFSLNLSQTPWCTTIGCKAGTTWAEPSRAEPAALWSVFVDTVQQIHWNFYHIELPFPDPTLSSEMCSHPRSLKPEIIDFRVHGKHLLFLAEQRWQIQQFVIWIINFPVSNKLFVGMNMSETTRMMLQKCSNSLHDFIKPIQISLEQLKGLLRTVFAFEM